MTASPMMHVIAEKKKVHVMEMSIRLEKEIHTAWYLLLSDCSFDFGQVCCDVLAVITLPKRWISV